MHEGWLTHSLLQMEAVARGLSALSHIMLFVLLRWIHAIYATHHAAAAARAHVCLLIGWLWRRPAQPMPLQQPPAHLGVVIGEGELRGKAELRRLAELIGWCVAAGIHQITVCDSRGDLAVAPHALCYALQTIGLKLELATKSHAAVSSPEAPLSTTLTSAVLAVRLISLQTGRDDIVGAARRLCQQVCGVQWGGGRTAWPSKRAALAGFGARVGVATRGVRWRLLPSLSALAQVSDGSLAASALDEAAVASQLCVNGDFPAPELVLQFCPELLLGGLLPWHCSVTQYRQTPRHFHHPVGPPHHSPTAPPPRLPPHPPRCMPPIYSHVGPLRSASEAQLRDLLSAYEAVVQRHGR